MEKPARGRPSRTFAQAQTLILECELVDCPHCQKPLEKRRNWHSRKTIQTLGGPVRVIGKSKGCVNPDCSRPNRNYYAGGLLRYSLPFSTYGLDVLAHIGWQHEAEHRQFQEIQAQLNKRGLLVNERSVGRLYRQFLALLGGLSETKAARLAESAELHGGLIWAMDALQPEESSSLLYVLYEVTSRTVVSGIQLPHAGVEELLKWLEPYRALPYPVLATLSDGEAATCAALRAGRPQAPHQLCQVHFLNNLALPVLELDSQLRTTMRTSLGGLGSVPEQAALPPQPTTGGEALEAPFL
jgi:hypothetical protein